jgi:NADP-dependent 3-hydroxy acid dehydrogenase YdfG
MEYEGKTLMVTGAGSGIGNLQPRNWQSTILELIAFRQVISIPKCLLIVQIR